MLPQRPLRMKLFCCRFLVPVGSASHMEVEIMPVIAQDSSQAQSMIWKQHWRYLEEHLAPGRRQPKTIPKMRADIAEKITIVEVNTGGDIWSIKAFVSPEIRTVIPT